MEKVLANKEDLIEIEERLKQVKDKRMYERLQTIRFFLMGLSVKEIEDMLCRSDRTIRTYISAYKEKGLDGLKRKSPPGKVCLLTQTQQDELKQVIKNNVPADVGYTAKFNWTLELIADYIKRT